MTAVVFIGPTISKANVLDVVDAICLPPAAQGDLYRAMRHNPTHIGLIDGYFDGVAAVWHKEILWAMTQGVTVFGASSMGALRASELADFGMIGIGKIFEGYYSGVFDDDDEVAVIHGPPEIGYPALCEPMVNIRATLERAIGDNILTSGKASETIQLAKSMHYRDRTWKNLITEINLGAEFGVWLKEGNVNQKHHDALAMLQALKIHRDEGEPNIEPEISFEFERTNQWVRATAQWDAEATSEMLNNNSVLDELRLLPDAFASACDAAMLRYSALSGPSNLQFEISRPVLNEKVNSFRMDHGLLSGAQLNQWLADNKLTTDEFERLLAEEVAAKDSIDLTSTQFHHYLLGHLKLAGEFSTLSTRAKNKQLLLDKRGVSSQAIQASGLLKPALLDWYFRLTLGGSIPSNIERYAVDLGLKDREAFYQILACEYLYLQDSVIE